MADPTPPTRWVVDSLADTTARVELDADTIVRLPRALLPADVREGDVLTVTATPGADQVTLVVARDPKAKEEALEASRRQLAGAPVDTSKGDITL